MQKLEKNKISQSGIPPLFIWGLAFPLAFLNLWLLVYALEPLKPLASLVITASLIAFLLSYPIRFLEKLGLKRSWAIAIVLLLALLLVTALVAIILPLLIGQLNGLLNNLPGWIESGKENLKKLELWVATQNYPVSLTQIITETTDKLSNELKFLSSQILGFILGTFTSALNALITFVLTVLLVINGDKVVIGLLSWLSPNWHNYIKNSLQETFQNYFVAQSLLAVVLGTALTIAFTLLQVPYSLLFGSIIGITALIPFAAVISITFTSILIGFYNISLVIKVLLVAVVIVQINDNFVAPRLMGDITGLNPFWVVISLLIGGKLGGVLGLLLAVPLASFIKRTADKLRAEKTEVNPF